jgi:hypothetical protein
MSWDGVVHWEIVDSANPGSLYVNDGWNGTGSSLFGEVNGCAGPTDLAIECAD